MGGILHRPTVLEKGRGRCRDRREGLRRRVPEAWTIRKIAAWMTEDFKSRGIESARLDAELLVAHSLGIDRVRLYMDLDRPLDDAERATVRELALRRRRREPIAYLTGAREFYGRRFRVTPDVLIPRPDTETLVDAALALLPLDAPARVLDLCTGSGAIAITIAAERPAASVDATDISSGALAVARENAERLGVADRTRWLEGDLFAPLARTTYDLVVANPPYVAESERASLAPDVRDFEPALALFAGDGFAVHRRIAGEVKGWLAPGGRVLVEVGAGQAGKVAALFADHGLPHVETRRDLGRIERVVQAGAEPLPATDRAADE
jgi:release factor glutamine methyltransferase